MKQLPSENRNRGYTLIELMVAMAMSLIVAVVVYTVYESQVRAQLTQELYTELQESMRVAMIIMEQEIRTAGSDPTGRANAGILDARADQLSFTRDIIGGDIDGRASYDGRIPQVAAGGAWGAGGTVGDMQEAVLYEVDAGTLTREIADGTRLEILDHVEALDFVYLDRDGAVLPRPVPDNRVDEIAQIEVTIVARSPREDGGSFLKRYTDTRAYENQQGDMIFWPDPAQNNQHFRRLRLSTSIACRNMFNN